MSEFTPVLEVTSETNGATVSEKIPHTDDWTRDPVRNHEAFTQDVVSCAADRMGITRGDILGRSHAQRFAKPRHYAVVLMRDGARLSFPAIAKALGRDHTTVMSSYQRGLALIDRREYARDFANIAGDVARKGWKWGAKP